jgi:fumarate hydratase subunit beta
MLNYMNEPMKITAPFNETISNSLCSGQKILLSGIIFTARDAAHKRLSNLILENRPLPVDLNNQVVYYTGRSPERPGHISGSAGPTTSSRMDPYAPLLIEKCGLRAMIGKGNRNAHVIDAIKKYRCVYFAATGGAGALLAKTIIKADIVCYEDLGPEAIYRLEVKDMPLIAAIDCSGGSIYCGGKKISFK